MLQSMKSKLSNPYHHEAKLKIHNMHEYEKHEIKNFLLLE